MLIGGALWAVERGYGTRQDLERIEEYGSMKGANPQAVSDRAKNRQRDEMGTLGSGNHYLEVQRVTEIYDAAIAAAFGLQKERCSTQHSLRLTRAGSPDRHGVS